MSEPITGNLLDVEEVTLGAEFAADAASGATVVQVTDTTDFDANDGGSVSIGGAQYTYAAAAVDEQAETITLDTPLAAAAAEGDRVDVWDTVAGAALVEYRARVQLPADIDGGDAADAEVAHPLIPMLPLGPRDPGTEEVVELVKRGGQWVVTNKVGGVPQVDGTFLAPGSVPDVAIGFPFGRNQVTIAAVAPASPNVGDLWFDTGNGNVMKEWDGTTWQPFQWNNGSLAPGSIDASKVTFTARSIGGVTTTFAAAAPGSPVVGDLWYDSSHAYRLSRWDGASWVSVQFGADAIANGSIDLTKVTFTARDLGGVTATFAAAAPASPKTGDLWYDSTNGYKLSQWSGAAWVAVQLGTNAIAAGSVTASLIAAHTVTAAQIAAGTITASEIAANTITAAQIAANTITAAQIAANTITAGQIAADTITAAQIAAGAITASELAANSVTASAIQANAVTAGAIAAGAVIAGKIAAGVITATELAANSITAGKIATDALNAYSIRSGSLSSATIAGHIVASSIGGSDFLVDGDNGRILVYSTVGTPHTFTTPGSALFLMPAGATLLKAECWGAGGGGAGSASGGSPRPGGGGGEYACNPLMLNTPGANLPYTVGAAGAGGTTGAGADGGDSGVGGSEGAIAHGGKGGTVSTGGTGGTSSSPTFTFPTGETVHFDGGTGNAGDGVSIAGGGGSSAAPTGAGAPGKLPGGATPPPGGGNGGVGASIAGGIGGNAVAPGGGGGGGRGAHGGNGADGQVVITTYTQPVLVASIASVAGTDSFGNSYPAGVWILTPQFGSGPAGKYYFEQVKCPAQVITTGGSAQTLANLTADKLNSDYGSGFNLTTGAWTCPVTGPHMTTISNEFSTAWVANSHVILQIHDVTGGGDNLVDSADETPQFAGRCSSTWLSNFTAGHVYKFQLFQNSGSSQTIKPGDTSRIAIRRAL